MRILIYLISLLPFLGFGTKGSSSLLSLTAPNQTPARGAIKDAASTAD